jgi:ABC-type polysaccharide/polyol phosphate export permease
MQIINDILNHRELLGNLVARNLKSRYKNSFLGFLWTIITPLFLAVIYMAFLRILARQIPMQEILIGVFAWQFTSQAVANGLSSVVENANLVKKVYFPRILLPLSTTLSNLVNFLLTLIVQFIMLIIILGINNESISWLSLAVPLVIIYHFFFCFSISILLSCLNVYFRDLEHLINILLLAWFFMSPIMYSISLAKEIIPEKLFALYLLNPLSVIVSGYRSLILPDIAFPVLPTVYISLSIPVILFIAAYIIFQKLQKNFSDVL